MKISVILPCFNAASTIAIQLEALCRQSWDGGWEVIFSDNGSTDESVAIVEQYRHRLPNLTIVSAYQPPGPRLGACHSYNTAFKVATGDAFVLCEADDEVGEGWLEAMGKALQEHEFVAARMDFKKLNPPWVLLAHGNGMQETEIPKIACYPYFKYAWGCTFGFRRSVYNQLGGFNLDFSCIFDAEFCWRAQSMGFDIYMVPDAVLHYRLRSNLNALLKQRQKWGEEFILLMRCYDSPPGKFMWLRSRLKLTRLALVTLALMVGSWLRIPQSRNYLYSTIAILGWELGAIRGRSVPIPPTYARKTFPALVTTQA
jgi:glycosyltransferase involved in cell wall biosynthesis